MTKTQMILWVSGDAIDLCKDDYGEVWNMQWFPPDKPRARAFTTEQYDLAEAITGHVSDQESPGIKCWRIHQV